MSDNKIICIGLDVDKTSKNGNKYNRAYFLDVTSGRAFDSFVSTDIANAIKSGGLLVDLAGLDLVGVKISYDRFGITAVEEE